VSDLATRLAGSRDIVDGPSGPLGTVNFVTAHDGFCLHDLVTYNVKHNQMNGEGNRDGNNNNFSFNHGAEGEVSDSEINQTRRRVKRNLLATLLLSAGIPMVTAGDERGKTQSGNNNAYCLDSTLSWMNWDLNQDQMNLEDTFAFLVQLRRKNPALHQQNFGNFEKAEIGSDRIRWFDENGEILTEAQWNNPEQRTLVRLVEHISTDGTLNTMLSVLHGSEREIELRLPNLQTEWQLLWDSYDEIPREPLTLPAGATLKVRPTSVLILRPSSN
jgi:glycogen operon protein